jgi:hypothetical protein
MSLSNRRIETIPGDRFSSSIFGPELLGKLSTLGVRVEATSYNGEAQRPSA